MKTQAIRQIILISIVAVFATQFAYARSLDTAATSAVNQIFSIAKKASLLPIGVGGLLFLMGASHLGKSILVGGIVGIGIIFGADGIRSAMTSVFGS